MSPSVSGTTAAGPSCMLPTTCDPAEVRALFDGWATTYTQEHTSWGYTAPQKMAAMGNVRGDINPLQRVVR